MGDSFPQRVQCHFLMDGSLPEQQMGSATLLSKSTCVHQRVGGGGEGDICMYECMHVCVCVVCG